MGGLKDVVDQKGGRTDSTNHRAYPYDEREEKLWEWFDELEERFPEDIECEFIEVSPRLERCHAKAYLKPDGTQYIRMADDYLRATRDWKVKRTLLHEMVHLYTYQKGHSDISDGSHLFKWLCGAVGAHINQVSENGDQWRDLAEPFAQEKEK